MPKKSLMVNEPQPTPLRRSPRFLHLQDTPKTPNPIVRAHPISSISPLTPSEPTSRSRSRSRYKCQDGFPKKSNNGSRGIEKSATGSRKPSDSKSNLKKDDSNFPKKCSKGLEKCEKSANGSKRVSRLSSRIEGTEGLRRSPRFCSEVKNSLVVVDVDRRITRSASKLMGVRTDLCEQTLRPRTPASFRNVVGKKNKQKQEGSGLSQCITSEPQKRITRSSAMIDGKKKEYNGKLEKESCDAVKLCNAPAGERKIGGEGDVCEDESRLIGVKRTRKQGGVQGTDQGWSKEQEVALQRAYFTAKPSPHFWKKVSKLVPGKSAQECFDKVHSENQTPLSTRPCSRAKKWNSASISPLSVSKLFKSAEKSKKTGRSKQKSHVARKTARLLLQKHCRVDQDTEADLFSVLEPTVNPSAEAFQLNAVQSTPQHLLGSPGSSSKCRERSSNHKIRVSRLSGALDSALTSPPVLKKVKNMTLHEKYIDQLHMRDAKRKLASKRCLKSVLCQKDGEENPAVIKDAIKAAKEALISDATNIINQFRHSQANIMGEFSDSEEGLDCDDEEEETIV